MNHSPKMLIVKEKQFFSFSNCSVATKIVGIAFVFFLISGCKKDNETVLLDIDIYPSSEAGTVEASLGNGVEYDEGTTLSLTAQSAKGYYFQQWDGDASGTGNPVEIRMDQDKEVEAHFNVGVWDDFEDDEADDFIDDGYGKWEVADTIYVMNGTGSGTIHYSYYDFNTFDNFEFSVDLKATGNTSESHAFGIYFRSQSADFRTNSYMLSIRANGTWQMGKYVNSGSLELIQSSTSSSDLISGIGSLNTIKVICAGSTIEVVINGVSQGSFTDSEFYSGYIGVFGFDGTDYTDTYTFDDFFVQGN